MPIDPGNLSYSQAVAAGIADPGDVAAARGQSATAVALITGGTIATANLSESRVAPAGAVTGVILQAGTAAGQTITVVNEAIAANTVTFAVAGTSFVSDGATSPLAGLLQRSFTWDSATSLWYRAA